MLEVLNVTLEKWNLYWNGSLYPWLFAASVLVVFITAFIKKDMKLNKLVLYTLLTILLVFLPPSAYILMRLSGTSIYWRMFWLLPAGIMIALACTIITGFVKNKVISAVITILLAVLIALPGKLQLFSDNFTEAKNYQQIPEDVAVICNTVKEDAGDTPVKLAANLYVSCYVRVFDPSIYMPYGRRGEDAEDKNAETLYYEMEAMANPDAIISGARAAECNYIVVDTTNDGIPEYFLERGYESLGMADQYAILKDLEASQEQK